MDTPPDSLRRYTPISVDGDALEPEETPVDNAQPEEFGAEPAAAAPPPEAPSGAPAPPPQEAPAAVEPLAPLPVPPPPLSPFEPAPVPVVSAPPRPARRRGAVLATLGGLALPVGVPLLVAAIGALSIVAWLRHEPKISESEPRDPQPMATPQGGPGIGQPPLGSPDMGMPGSGMGSPGMGDPGMGAPGMGAPGMGAPGMGAPGMGGPGMGGPGGPDGGMPSPDGMPPGGPPGMSSEPPPGFSGGPGGMGAPSSGSLPGPGTMGGGPGPGGGGRMFVPPATPGGGGGSRGFRGGPGGGRGSGAPPGNAVSGVVGGIKGAWSTYRGPNHDGVNADTTALAKSWGQGGPRRLWQVKLGEGYAGPAVLNGRVYVLDYDQSARADKLRCLELATGRELWSQSYPVDVKRNHGMSRTVPAATTQFVVTLGPKCHVMCCDAVRGTVKWRMDLVCDWGTKVPTWYAGQCPLIDGNRVILAPGGKALMMAVDLATGKVAWKTPNPNGWQMTHSSIVPTTIGGVRMYVYPFSGGVAGIDAKTGKLLWSTKQWTVSTANIPMPIPVGDGRIFLSGGYNAGAMMLKVSKQGAGFSAAPMYKLQSSVFGSDQQTPILYKGSIYGVIPSGELACIDLNGKPLWRSGSTNRFGIGAYMIAGGMIYVVDDDGKLTLAEASPAGYKPLGTAKVLPGPDAWGPMAMVSGRLLLRDLTTMVCLDVRKS